MTLKFASFKCNEILVFSLAKLIYRNTKNLDDFED